MVDFKKYADRTNAKTPEPRVALPRGGGMSLDAFLGHRTSGGSGEYLRSWRKDGEIKVWLHQYAEFHALWNHNWPQVKTIRDKTTREEKLAVFSSRFICHDPETVTRKARFKEDDGRREHRPVRCPMCFFLDWLGGEVGAGRVDWTTPLFKFEGDGDEQYNVTLHAGGMLGLFGGKDVTKEQKQELRKAGIVLKDSWREKAEVRCQYLFQVVDDADPSAGVVKALEANDLADKLKTAIQKERKRKGDRGNPGKNPYPFLWTYDDAAEQFNKKYDVTPLDDEPSEEILAFIGDPDTRLDLSKDVAPGDCVLLCTEMENASTGEIEIPWDEIFGPAERAGLMKPQASPPKRSTVAVPKAPARSKVEDDEEDDDEQDDEEDEDEMAACLFPKAAASAKVAQTKQTAAKAPPPAEEPEEPAAYDDENNACEFCEEEIGADDLDCPHCGSTYEDDGENIRLAGVPCREKGCEGVVPILEADEKGECICPKCATVHRFVRTKREGDMDKLSLEIVRRNPPVEEKAAPARTGGRRGRGGAGAKSAKPAEKKQSTATVAGGEGDELPW